MLKRSRLVHPSERYESRLERAQRLARGIQRTFEGADIPTSPTVNYCVRPSMQLFDLKRRYALANKELMKAHGFVPRTQPSLDRSDTAYALFYASAHSLEDRSHRFTFFIDGTVAYHQEPFNVDCQTLPSERINLHTLRDISENNDAMVELRWLAEELQGTEPALWRVRPELGRVPIQDC